MIKTSKITKKKSFLVLIGLIFILILTILVTASFTIEYSESADPIYSGNSITILADVDNSTLDSMWIEINGSNETMLVKNGSLEYVDHLDSEVSELYSKDGSYYLADMKDDSKRLYINFTSEVFNGDIVSFYARQDTGVTIGIYDQDDTTGTNPLGTFTVDSISGDWYNITLSSMTEPTTGLWIGEGTGSGTDPKDEFDYVVAIHSKRYYYTYQTGLEEEGLKYYTIWANDTSNNLYSESSNFEILSSLPQLNSIRVSDYQIGTDYIVKNGVAYVKANITDNIGIDTVWLQVPYQNLTTAQNTTDFEGYYNYTMNYDEDDGYYKFLFSVDELGAGWNYYYNFTIYYNDTDGNVRNQTQQFQVILGWRTPSGIYMPQENSEVELIEFTEDVNYNDSGIMKAIYPQLVESDQPGYSYGIKSGHYHVDFKDVLNSTQTIYVHNNDGNYVVMDIERYLYESTTETDVVQVIKGTGSKPVKDEYKNQAFDNHTIRFKYAPTRLKEDIIVESKPREPTIDNVLYIEYETSIAFNSEMHIFAEGSIQTSDFITDEDIELRLDSDDSIIYKFPKPYITDNLGAWVYGDYKLEGSGTDWTIKVRVPYSWFNDSAREYPITVDPSTVTRTNTTAFLAVEDTFVEEGSPADTNGARGYMYTRDTVGGDYRMYVKYNISELDTLFPTWYQVEIGLALYSAAGAPPEYVNGYYVYNDSWDEATMNWTNQPCGEGLDDSGNCNLTPIDTTEISGADGDYFYWNATDATGVNTGDMISFAFQSLNSTTNIFSTSEDTSSNPYLKITYTIPVEESTYVTSYDIGLGQSCSGLAYDGTYLYALVSGADTIRAYSISRDGEILTFDHDIVVGGAGITNEWSIGYSPNDINGTDIIRTGFDDLASYNDYRGFRDRNLSNNGTTTCSGANCPGAHSVTTKYGFDGMDYDNGVWYWFDGRLASMKHVLEYNETFDQVAEYDIYNSAQTNNDDRFHLAFAVWGDYFWTGENGVGVSGTEDKEIYVWDRVEVRTNTSESFTRRHTLDDFIGQFDDPRGIEVTDNGLYVCGGQNLYVFGGPNYAPGSESGGNGTVEIVPVNPTTSDDLNCSANFTDNQQETIDLEFQWYKNGVYNSSYDGFATDVTPGTFGYTNVTVPSADTAPGENWTCRARAYDGFEYSDWVNDTEEILAQPPTITVDSHSAITLSQGASVTEYFYFNVTEGDVAINISTANMKLNKVSESAITANSCINITTVGDTTRFNCTFTIPYFTASGSWYMNASIEIEGGTSYYNDTETVTVNQLDAITLDESSISCGTSIVPGTDDQACTTQTVNNVGNTDYSIIGITGFDLEGTKGGGSNNLISATNFCGNDINDANTGCNGLINNTEVDITGTTIPKGLNSNDIIYQYIDVPTGILGDTYTSLSNYVYTAKV